MNAPNQQYEPDGCRLQVNKPLRHVRIAVDMGLEYGRGVMRGITAYAREAGNWVPHLTTRTPNRLAGRMPSEDGIILSATREMEAWLRHVSIPKVNVIDIGFGEIIPTVCRDNVRAGQIAAEHLLERGFTRFACFPLAGCSHSIRRYRGFADTVSALGFECQKIELPRSDDELMRWLHRQRWPLGVLTYCDSPARRLAELAWQTGKRLPDELAIVGIGNDPMLCEIGHVRLSSIVPPSFEIGYEAARTLDEWMDAGGGEDVAPAPERFLDAGTLIMRESSDIWLTANPHVLAALDYIRRHIHTGFGVEQVADAVGLSCRQLNRLCHESMGRTTSKVIAQTRLDRAREMLAGDDLSIAEISEACGFGSVSYFTTVFRRATGHPPAAFRNSLQGYR